MKRKQILRLLSRGFLCLLVSAVFWSWVFTFLTDTGRENKIVIYANMKDFDWKKLAISLEEQAPENNRFVQVHPFSYAMMSSSDLEQADLYIMTAAQAEEFSRFTAPLPAELPEELISLPRDKTLRGLLLFDAETGSGTAVDYLNYAYQPGENWYLFFGANSLHLPAGENKEDTAATETARILLTM